MKPFSLPLVAVTTSLLIGEASAVMPGTPTSDYGFVGQVGSGAGAAFAWNGSGTAINEEFVLTANHVVTLDGLVRENIKFRLSPSQEHQATEVWLGFGSDLALVKVTPPLPSYTKIFRGTSELNRPVTVVGWGKTGFINGAGLWQLDDNSGGVKRVGSNVASVVVGNGLADPFYTRFRMDFDGTPPGGSLVDLYGDGGPEPDEVLIVGGDSGGPSLIEDQVAGVHSYNTGLQYGSYGDDARVTIYQNWIDRVLDGTISPGDRFPSHFSITGKFMSGLPPAFCLNDNARVDYKSINQTIQVGYAFSTISNPSLGAFIEIDSQVSAQNVTRTIEVLIPNPPSYQVVDVRPGTVHFDETAVIALPTLLPYLTPGGTVEIRVTWTRSPAGVPFNALIDRLAFYR